MPRRTPRHHLPLIPGLFLLLAQLPAPAAAETSAGFQLRLRGEVWDAPAGAPGLDQEYDFGLARARVNLDGTWDAWSLHAVLQGAAAAGLPDRGSFGAGPVYVSANEGETDPSHAGIAELSVGYRNNGFAVVAGRQKSSEGFEAATGVAYLDGVKRARVAERLVGNWDWVNVGRRFDGVAVDLDHELGAGRLHWSGYALRPLAGGVDHEDAFEQLDDLTIYGLSATAGGLAWPALESLPYRELRVGLIQYDDGRPGARAAAGGDVEVTTLVAHWLAGDEDRDVVLWAALQDGDWGPAEHGAWAAFAEAGRAFPGRAGSPTFRFGLARASGDGSPGRDHKDFFNLLPTNHKWYGGMDFSAFSNLETLYAQASATLPAAWKATVEIHTFRLADRDGSWWGGSGAFDDRALGYAARRPPGGFTSSHLGEELDLTVARPLPAGFALTLGGSYFAGASAAEQFLREDADGTWLFAELTWSR